MQIKDTFSLETRAWITLVVLRKMYCQGILNIVTLKLLASIIKYGRQIFCDRTVKRISRSFFAFYKKPGKGQQNRVSQFYMGAFCPPCRGYGCFVDNNRAAN